MRTALRVLGIVLSLGLLALAAALALAHASLRGVASPPLPSPDEFRAAAAAGSPADRPVAVVAVDTASQEMARSLVLDPGRDPTPGGAYTMSHPAFLLRWADGRGLLIDAGMEPAAARAFGRPMELAGAAPIRPHGAAADQLGARVARGRLGLVFTHLHTDHVQGVAALCSARGGEAIELFQTSAQAGLVNYTTRPGARAIEAAPCLRRVPLPEGALAALPGFGGVHVLHAAGHTPGSQVVFARVAAADGRRERTLAFTGDVVNHVDGARHDVPKPLLYRLLVVPEDDARLGALRRMLGRLESEAGAELVVSHDRLQLEALGLLPPAERLSRSRAAEPESSPR